MARECGCRLSSTAPPCAASPGPLHVRCLHRGAAAAAAGRRRAHPARRRGPHGRDRSRAPVGARAAGARTLRPPLRPRGRRRHRRAAAFIKTSTAGHGRRDLLLVATETNWVYAFDLTTNAPIPATPPLAARQLEPTGRVRPAICDETPSQRVGITATPVIDPATRRMYVVARNADDHQYVSARAGLDGRFGRRAPAGAHRGCRSRAAASGSTPTASGTDRRCCSRAAWSMPPSAAWAAIATARPTSRTAAGCLAIARRTSRRRACFAPARSRRGTPASGRAAGGWRRRRSDLLSDRQWPRAAGRRVRGPGTAPGLELAAVHRPANHAALDRADVDLGSGAPVWLPPGLLLGAGKEGRFALLDARRRRWRPVPGRLSGVREQLPRGCVRARLWRAGALGVPDQLRHRRARLLHRPRPLSKRRGLRPERQRRPRVLARRRGGLWAGPADGRARLPEVVPVRPARAPPGFAAVRGFAGARRRGDVRRVRDALGGRRAARDFVGQLPRSAIRSGKTCQGAWRRSIR